MRCKEFEKHCVSCGRDVTDNMQSLRIRCKTIISLKMTHMIWHWALHPTLQLACMFQSLRDKCFARLTFDEQVVCTDWNFALVGLDAIATHSIYVILQINWEAHHQETVIRRDNKKHPNILHFRVWSTLTRLARGWNKVFDPIRSVLSLRLKASLKRKQGVSAWFVALRSALYIFCVSLATVRQSSNEAQQIGKVGDVVISEGSRCALYLYSFVIILCPSKAIQND